MRSLVLVSALVIVGCGPGTSTIGGSGGSHHGTGGSGTGAGGTGGSGAGNGGGSGMQCTDNDHDGVTTCAGDCDDNDPTIYPGATETLNGKDDDCDGKIDNHICGRDYDMDGANYCNTTTCPCGAAPNNDCNDDDPNIGPNSVEVPGDMVDNNCNGMTDEAAPTCDTGLSSTSAMDYAKSIGLCNFVTAASFVSGDPTARNIRGKFGEQFTPQEGASMFIISNGTAKDDIDPGNYNPQPGKMFGLTAPHPLWSKPRCGNGMMPPGGAQDMTEIDFTVKVPANANAFTYNFAFFSAEYPEFVCTDFNDRFIAILQSGALDPTMLPMGQCVAGSGTPQCNISYDSMGQPVTINNGFFDVCDSYSGPNASGQMVSNTCTKGSAALAKTGYDQLDMDFLSPTYMKKVGGGTGWLKTTAPVKPGETITLRFIVLDEGDDQYDSAVLIDNFQWQATAVQAPVTEPTIN
jgi:hypothetical protein